MTRFTMAAAGLLLLGCASLPGTGEAAAPSRQAADGLAYAAAHCSTCHAIGPMGDSPRANAPPFRDLRIRFNAITWERTLGEIAKGGHAEMPPLTVEGSDVANVKAYIETLR